MLEDYGYVQTSLVTSTGEYALRGYIVDIFVFNQDNPIRIELFGNEIESIRYFDASSQRSLQSLNSFELIPVNEHIGGQNSSLYDYLKSPQVFFIDYDLIKASYKKLQEDIFEYNISKNIEQNFKYMFDFNEIKLEKQIFINTLDDAPVLNDIKKYQSMGVINFNNNFDNLEQYVRNIINDKIIVFMLTNENLINKLISIFGNEISFNSTLKGRVNIVKKDIDEGFIFDNLVVISQYDIENIKKQSIFINKYNIGRKIKGFEDLKKGDYVVHVIHGIGQYQGLVTLEKNKIKKDYLLINYAGNDKVYIPAQKIETIYKYSDGDSNVPALNSLSSSNWQKTKARVRTKIKDISNELIKLYAEREQRKGFAFSPDCDMLEDFENDFQYTLTPDQKRAIMQVKEDMKI